MRFSIASRRAIEGNDIAGICGVFEAAVAGLVDRVAAVEPGRAVSLTFKLPSSAFDFEIDWRGDKLWLAPSEGAHFLGGGEVTGFRDIGADRLQSVIRRWVRLGDKTVAPLLFFTAPAAPHAGPVTMCLPQVLVRRHADGMVVTLSAVRDSAPVAAIVRVWLAQLRSMLSPSKGRGANGAIERLASFPDRAEWRKRVRAAVSAIASGRFAKLVLARKLVVSLGADMSPDDLANRLAETCPECRIIMLPQANGHIVAASPELLAVKRCARIVSHALAGTAARFSAPDADALAAARLFASPKERREHQVVVEAIAGGLSEICDDVCHASEPTLMRLRRLQHLWTPVFGVLRQGFGLLDVVARLHPTPAVLGFPRLAAMNWLQQAEEHRDGLYTGVAGWLDLDGDGEAAVVLRSAYLAGRKAHLWAGAGIMAESDPDDEWAETELKMTTMLELLGGNGK